MITYKDMTFCLRKGCPMKRCPRHLVHADYAFGLPVSVADFWGEWDLCPSKEPQKMTAFQKSEGDDTDA